MSIRIEYYTIAEVSKLTGLSKKTIHNCYGKKCFRNTIQLNGKKLIPVTEVVSLVNNQKAINKLKKLGTCPAIKRDEALLKLSKIVLYANTKKELRYLHGAKEADRIAIERCGIPRGTLYRWRKKYYQDGLAGLIDTRGGSRKG